MRHRMICFKPIRIRAIIFLPLRVKPTRFFQKTTGRTTVACSRKYRQPCSFSTNPEKILKANYAAARLLGHTPVRLEQTFFADYLKKADRDSFLIVTKKLKSSRNHSIWEGQTAKTERIFRIAQFFRRQKPESSSVSGTYDRRKEKTGQRRSQGTAIAGRQPAVSYGCRTFRNRSVESVAFEKTGYGRNAFPLFRQGWRKFPDSFLLPTSVLPSLWNTIHSDSVEKIRGALRSAINSKIGFDIEIRINKPNGDFAWVNWKCFLIEENQTGAILLEGIALDITSHKTTERALAIARQSFRKQS